MILGLILFHTHCGPQLVPSRGDLYQYLAAQLGDTIIFVPVVDCVVIVACIDDSFYITSFDLNSAHLVEVEYRKELEEKMRKMRWVDLWFYITGAPLGVIEREFPGVPRILSECKILYGYTIESFEFKKKAAAILQGLVPCANLYYFENVDESTVVKMFKTWVEYAKKFDLIPWCTYVALYKATKNSCNKLFEKSLT